MLMASARQPMKARASGDTGKRRPTYRESPSCRDERKGARWFHVKHSLSSDVVAGSHVARRGRNIIRRSLLTGDRSMVAMRASSITSGNMGTQWQLPAVHARQIQSSFHVKHIAFTRG